MSVAATDARVTTPEARFPCDGQGRGDDRRLWGKGEEGEKIIGPFGVSMGWDG